MAEIASAFVSILPSFRGGASALSKQLDGPAATAGKTGGKAYSSAFSSSFKGLVAGLGATFAAVKIVDVFKDSVREASNLNESINAVRVSYGKAATDILKIGKNAAEGFGLSRSEFNGFAVQFQSFSKTIAGVDGDVSKTFESIIGRATDFASVMNLGVNEAATLFQSGLAGETEPLRRFGIDLSAATVEAYALSSGLVKNKSELTEAMKVQARYGSLMEQTSKFQGDWNNTSHQAAGQQKILSAQVKELKASFGSALIPVLTKVALVLNNGVIPALRGSAQFVKSNATTIKILGVTIGSFFLPYLVASTVAFATNAVSVVTTTAAWLAYGIIVKATAVATKVFTAGQWLLNAALTANPIGLVIVAIAALVAGIIIAYKKSATFRAIVQLTWAGIKASVSAGAAFVIGALNRIGDGISNVIRFFRQLPGKIKDAFGNAKSMLVSVGKNIVQGLINGIKSMGGQIKDVLIGLLPGPLKKFAGKLGIASPSKVFEGFGMNIGQGLVLGIDKTRPDVSAASVRMAQSVAVPAGARFDAAASNAASSNAGNLELIRGELSIDKDGRAWIEGVAQRVVDDQDFKNTVKSRTPGAFAGSPS